jgi:5-methylcytosine-specific restriction protein A
MIVLTREPLCRACKLRGKLVPATDVDHIDGDVRNMADENLQPLCHSCHSEKTAREDGGLGRKRKDD